MINLITGKKKKKIAGELPAHAPGKKAVAQGLGFPLLHVRDLDAVLGSWDLESESANGRPLSVPLHCPSVILPLQINELKKIFFSKKERKSTGGEFNPVCPICSEISSKEVPKAFREDETIQALQILLYIQLAFSNKCHNN